MSGIQRFVLAVEALAVLGVYLFVTAPPPLEARVESARRIPVGEMFLMLNEENARARALYTQEIVAAGTDSGLSFGEDWRKARDGSGPLPALFLRETAAKLEAKGSALRLFLGSDQPINKSNKLTGEQGVFLAEVRRTRSPALFYAADIRQHTAMFPDVAVHDACVDCHNGHKRSPKDDWTVGDVMGAVTWTYPKDSVTSEELAELLTTLRSAIGDAYDEYLAGVRSVRGRGKGPTIGDGWPKEGYALPSRQVFLGEMSARTSSVTLSRLVAALRGAR